MRRIVLAAMLTAAAPAVAQTAGGDKGGVTSGPAAGTPTTLGTGGESATQHQTDSLKNKGGPSVKGEKQGQAGGTNSSVKPGVPDQESGVVSRKPQQ